MRTLRGPDGCPWDRTQTLESLRPFVLEEAYEVLDAIERGDAASLCGEIGDLVFEGVFLAQLSEESGDFDIADSLQDIIDKLIRRHPHVFGEPDASADGPSITTPSQVKEQWERVKADERARSGNRTGLLAGVPRALPALIRAFEIGSRVASVGFDWDRADQVLEKLEEEVAELRHAVRDEGLARTEEEMGDLLFSVANLSRKLGVEPEAALRRANDKFTARFEAIERRFDAAGRSIHDASAEEMEREWQAVKAQTA